MRSLLAVFFLLTAARHAYTQDSCIGLNNITDLKACTSYRSVPDTIGAIGQKEISGIAPSLRHPGHFWGINDSGNGAVLYLYSMENAELRALFILTGLSNLDWEDLSISRSSEGYGTLHIPDIGDNKAKRKVYSIYKIPEPALSDNKINHLGVTPEVIRFYYSDGSRDAEAMTYDPVDQSHYIITKREEEVHLYRLEDSDQDSVRSINPIGTLPLTNVVAADFSLDGMQFILKTYTQVFLWSRSSPTESFCEMISRKPLEVPYQLEPQGESICFTEKGFITLSEERFGIKPTLYQYLSLIHI